MSAAVNPFNERTDDIPKPATIELIVLAPPSRTATSLHRALTHLKYPPSPLTFTKTHLWTSAFLTRAADPTSKPLSASDFANLLAPSRLASGLIASVFAEDLIQAYPHAKLIVVPPPPPPLAASSPSGPSRFSSVAAKVAEKGDPRYRDVRRMIAAGKTALEAQDGDQGWLSRVSCMQEKGKRKILEWDGSGGWAELCAFLGVSEPGPLVHFPGYGEGDELGGVEREMLLRAVGVAAAKVLGVLGVVAVWLWVFRMRKAIWGRLRRRMPGQPWGRKK